MKDRYVSCYFSGRLDAFDGQVDTAQLVERVQAGLPLRDATIEAARRAITGRGEMDTSAKLRWVNDNLDEIKVMGGDAEKAWRLYGQGRTDALARQLEDDVLASIEEEDDEDDEEGDDEGEDGEDGEDDEDDEDDEEDDDEGDETVAAEVDVPAPEDDKGEYYVTDEGERELFRRRTRTAAKRLALKLVRDRKHRALEVHRMFRGRLHLQGVATRQGWSEV
jgi:hypothetical protein